MEIKTRRTWQKCMEHSPSSKGGSHSEIIRLLWNTKQYCGKEQQPALSELIPHPNQPISFMHILILPTYIRPRLLSGFWANIPRVNLSCMLRALPTSSLISVPQSQSSWPCHLLHHSVYFSSTSVQDINTRRKLNTNHVAQTGALTQFVPLLRDQ